MKTKTIFISILSGIAAKNLMRTAVASSLLADETVRVVLLAADENRAAYYRREFCNPRITVEAIPPYQTRPADTFFRGLSFYTLNTATMRWRALLQARAERRPLRYPVALFFHFLLGRKSVVHIARFFDRMVTRRRIFSELFSRHTPAALVCANLFDEREVHLLREAKRSGVPTIGYINSWDKITARAVLRDVPDRSIVFNDTLREDMVRYQAASRERVTVCGIPQYDYFWRPEALFRSAGLYGTTIRSIRSRAEFLKSIGLAETDRFVFYAPLGPSFSESDWVMIDLLSRMERENRLAGMHLFVRFPPNDSLDEAELARRPHLRFHRSGIRWSASRAAVDWDMPFEDMLLLYETLRYASATIGYASSITIDSSIFGTPSVNINFEVGRVRDPRRAPTVYYRFAHYQRALKTGAVALVASQRELEEELSRAVRDPSARRLGREQLVREQCQCTDGRSGERIAAVILDATRAL